MKWLELKTNLLPKTSMLFGDAKKALNQLVSEIKALG